ncbi:MAG: ABC-three component system middle component 1 [Sarcina sp.]
MLLSKNEIIKEYNLLDGIKNIKEMNCWIKKEKKHNIYIFTIEISDDKNLYRLSRDITSNIAFDFQTTLKLDLERWNIYLIFIVNDIVSMDIKYKIEQDIFSVRKIIYDQLISNSENDMKKIIEDKLFNIFSEDRANKDSFEKRELINLLKEENLKYCSLLEIKNEEEILKEYIGGCYE